MNKIIFFMLFAAVTVSCSTDDKELNSLMDKQQKYFDEYVALWKANGKNEYQNTFADEMVKYFSVNMDTLRKNLKLSSMSPARNKLKGILEINNNILNVLVFAETDSSNEMKNKAAELKNNNKKLKDYIFKKYTIEK